MTISFAETLRLRHFEGWTRATVHRFTVELGDGRLDDAVLRRYLVQDYAFVVSLASLVGHAIATAPTMAGKRLLATFAAALTSEENTYFERAFDALGVPAADRTEPELWPESRRFLALLEEGATGSYADALSVLLPAEWIYLDWGTAEAVKRPPRFEHREWIDLHSGPIFAAFVSGLRSEFDAAAATLADGPRRRIAERFGAMVALEGEFFEAAYRPA